DPCENHKGFTEKDANEVMENWPANLLVSRVNRTHKCRVACILSYYMLLGYEGQITLDKYLDAGIIDEYEVASTLLRCKYEYKDEKDICEFGFGIFYCFRMELLLKS
ncbi:hypothetical protein KR067_010884, partial [Drosophila pandora]